MTRSTALLAIGFSMTAALASEAFCGTSCTEVMKPAARIAAISKIKVGYQAYRNLVRRLPFLYFSPLPRLGWRLNLEALKATKVEYRAALEKALIDAQGAKSVSLPDSIQPKTNEQKLALLEVIREVLEDRIDATDDSLFKEVIAGREKDLIKLLNQWAPTNRSLDPEVLNKIVDLHYLVANDLYFRFRNLPSSALNPSESLQALVRARWQTEVTRSTLPVALKELGIMTDKLSFRSRFENTFGTFLKASLNVFMNYQAIVLIHFPVFFPNMSLLNRTSARAEAANIVDSIQSDGEEAAFAKYSQRFSKMFGFEYIKGWARKFTPLVLAGVIAYSSYTAVERFNEKFDHDGTPNLSQVQAQSGHAAQFESRAHIESVLRAEMEKEYSELHGGAKPDAETEKNFTTILETMRIHDLDLMRNSVQNGGKLPQSVLE